MLTSVKLRGSQFNECNPYFFGERKRIRICAAKSTNLTINGFKELENLFSFQENVMLKK